METTVVTPNASVVDPLLQLPSKAKAQAVSLFTERVKKALVEKLLETQVALGLAGYQQLQQLQTELRKIEKPDIEAVFDIRGMAIVPPGYKKETTKKIAEHKLKILKVEKALIAAHNGDFSKLQEVTGAKGG